MQRCDYCQSDDVLHRLHCCAALKRERKAWTRGFNFLDQLDPSAKSASRNILLARRTRVCAAGLVSPASSDRFLTKRGSALLPGDFRSLDNHQIEGRCWSLSFFFSVRSTNNAVREGAA